ncbi:hypothetical protein [Vibrio sp. Hal054]|uniref:hypothetical protein n=1 Tax=Vibrio sp. Hal054 TaxID=3035158 RepID=UPI00301E48F5
MNTESVQNDNLSISVIVYLLVAVFNVSSLGLNICLQLFSNVLSLGFVGGLTVLGLLAVLKYLPHRIGLFSCILITAFVSFISTGVGIFIAFLFV